MALTAKFVAEFSGFHEAVQKAETNLKSLETGASKVGDALNRMVDKFSGRKLIQDATMMAEAVERIGGPSKLTASELQNVALKAKEAADKMRALGIDVPKQIDTLASKVKGPLAQAFDFVGAKVAAAFTFTAIVAAGKKLIDFGSDLSDLAAKTGISTTGLQKLDLAFSRNGITLDTVTSAVTKLSKALFDGDKSTIKTLNILGLNLEALKKMSPEEMFIAVADAIGKIPSPTEKAWAAMQVFGRGGAELLAGLDGQLKETTDKFESMGLIVSEDVVKAADDFGDQLGLMGKQLMALLGSIIGPLLPALSALGQALLWIGQKVIGPVLNVAIKSAMTLIAGFWEGLSTLLGGIAQLASKLPGVGKHFGELATWLNNSSAATTKYLHDLWNEEEKVGTTAAAATPKLLGLGKATEEAGKGAKVLAKEIPVVNSAVADLAKLVSHAAMQSGLQQINRDIETLTGTLEEFKSRFSKRAEMFPDWVGNLADFEKWKKSIGGGIKETLPVMTQVLGNLRQFPSLLVQSFSGGGGIKGAVNALGAQIGGSLFGTDGALSKVTQSATAGLSSIFGKTLGGALGAAIPGIGALIGPGIQALTAGVGKLFGKMFGTAGRDSVREFANSLGGFDELHQKLGQMGAAGEKLWISLTQGVGRNNKEEAEKAIKTVTEALKAHEAEVAKAAETMNAFAAIDERLQNLITISPDVKAALDLALEAKTPEDFRAAIEAINTELTEQESQTKFLTETMSKYGLSWKDLGEEARKGFVSKEAASIEKEFRVLVGAGADVNAIMRAMGKSINEFVTDAKKSGTEIPESFRDIIQTAIDAGEIFDDNGDKITDMKDLGLKFGETMETSMKKAADSIATALDKLVKLFEQQLGPAITNLPQPVLRGRVEWDVSAPPSGDGGQPGFASGTGGRYLDFGAGTNVRLHGKERVMTEAEGRAEAGMWGSLTAEVSALRAELTRQQRHLPHLLMVAMRDGLVQAQA